jgi:hypothetical protein
MKVKVFGLIAASVFGLFILSAVLNGIYGFDEMVVDPQIQTAIQMGYFILFLILGFSVIPLFVRLFVVMQIKIGHGELAPIKFLKENEKVVVYCIWAFLAIGLCIALPGSIEEGFFK